MIELEKGFSLIEASAGTGKTYTLVRIALRLTLEKGIPLDRILAVTFTEAATEELASRIRELYQSCLQELETGQLEEENLIKALQDDSLTPEEAKRRLRYSLEVFDEAPISTIHGFCKRALDIVALDTKAPLDASLENVENDLIEQLQNEYLRQNVFERSEALTLFYGLQKNFEKRLTALGKESAAHPQARLKPEFRAYPLDSIDEKYKQLIDDLAKFLETGKSAADKLSKASRIHKYLTGKLPALEAIPSRGCLLSSEIEILKQLTPELWTKALNKAHKDLAPPPALERIAAFTAEIDQAFQSLLLEYKSWLAENLKAAKERRNVISFNDLIHRLNAALQGEQGERVASQLSSRYDAALIDEFQDTDPIQYKIAQALFGNGQHYLFFIGDPKQAIYRFRGADIFAYFEATRSPDIRRYDLEKNYRSRPDLITATNALFEASAEGFVFDEIQFKPVSAGREENKFPPTSVSPFLIRSLAGDPASKERQRQLLSQHAAEDFSLRLNEDTSLQAEDVAFLVNDKTEANALSQELERRGISAVIRAERSIFDSSESEALRQLLVCLAAPSRLSLKRGLLLTSLCGLAPFDLVSEDPNPLIESIFQHLSDWAQNWPDRNFDVSLNQLLAVSDALHRLTLSADGERRFTNLSHLAELLEEAKSENALTPQGLLNWLDHKQDADVSREEDWQTRLSSDSGKPQIITLHKSKGLQFPIVILPFITFLRVKKNPEYSVYHDNSSPANALVIDLSVNRDEKALEMAYREELSEKIRLLYVALTRAEWETCIYLAPESNSSFQSPSAFAQMLLGSDICDGPNKLKPEEIDQELDKKLTAIAKEYPSSFSNSIISEKPVSISPYRDTQSATPIIATPRSTRRAILSPRERILSFSAISRQMSAGHIDVEDEAQDDESILAPSLPEEAAPDLHTQLKSIFNLPKGAHAGDLFHLILERADFSKTKSIQAETEKAFDELQFQPSEYRDIVFHQILQLAQTPLQTPQAQFRLADIPPQARIPELEFAYPVKGDVQSRLLDALQNADLGKIPPAWLKRFDSSHSTLSASLLRGFIDLVFEHQGRLYIIDWKSNYLGDRPSQYTENKMSEAMADHDYFLQYLLYCVALKRFLENRFPEEPFEKRLGGVFYIFIRGLKSETANGIYFDLPTSELINRIDQALLAST